jgi:hypothetical protein
MEWIRTWGNKEISCDRFFYRVAAWELYAKENGMVEPDRPVGYAKAPRKNSF